MKNLKLCGKVYYISLNNIDEIIKTYFKEVLNNEYESEDIYVVDFIVRKYKDKFYKPEFKIEIYLKNGMAKMLNDIYNYNELKLIFSNILKLNM